MGRVKALRSVAVFHIGGVSGPQRSLGQTARWLKDRGSVEFIVPEPGPTADEYSRFGPVEVHDYAALTYPRGPGSLGKAVMRLARETRMFRREWRRRRPDAVLVVTTVVPTALLAARLERIPTVVYASEIYEQWKRAPRLRVWGALLIRGTSALSDGVVCCSAAVASQFPADGHKPLSIAYPPVGPEHADGDRARGRARFALADEDTCLTVVGSISRGRGQDVALRALARVRRRFPAARLLVVGSPHPRRVDLEFAEELRALAGQLGVSDGVTFAGTVATTDGAMADVYAASDVVINPARSAEAFGRVIPEALMAGRPVVASRIGGIPEVIRDGVDGLLVPPDAADALAAGIVRVLEDPALADAMVESGQRRVRDKFGHDQDREAWTQVFEAVVSGRPELARADGVGAGEQDADRADERYEEQRR
jgi:glycosyltransferase involved in cell wall biosynthesis